jgi:ferredoxin
LLDEIWRVLAPGGAVIVAEEPIRRRLRIPLFRTQASDRLRGLTRWLLKLGWLPYLARIGGHDETRHGVIERDFAPMGLSRLFARYTDAAWFFTPSLTGGASALGPLARRLWRVDGADAAKMRGLASWFGGAVRGWLTKPLGVRALSPGRYLVRKDPRHDRVAVRGFSGAFLADGQTLAADHETAELPRETLGRVHLLLDIPRPFQRIDLWSSDGGTGLATHFPPGEAEAPASVPDVACPDCVEFTARCIYGFCARECVAACPRDALAPTDPRLPVRASCNGCGACLRACPYGGLDRPRLGDGRCPSCRRLFSAEADVLDCRPRTLGERIDLAALETVSLENVWT